MNAISIAASCLAYVAAAYTAGRLGTRLPAAVTALLVALTAAAVAVVWWRDGPGAALIAITIAGFFGWYGIRHSQDGREGR